MKIDMVAVMVVVMVMAHSVISVRTASVSFGRHGSEWQRE